MLKRNKAISIVLAFVFCMTFLAPALVSPGVAEASCTYEVLKAPVVTTGSGAQDLGVVKVTLPDTALFTYDTVTVSLPSDLSFVDKDGKADTTVNVVGSAVAKDGIQIVAPGGSDGLVAADFNETVCDITGSNNFDIQLADSVTPGTDKYFYIYFNGVNLNNMTGDVEVSFTAPANSGFSSSANLAIAKSTNSGSTTTTIKKVNQVNDNGGAIDSITVLENAPGSINVKGGTITLEILTKGFEWDSDATPSATYGWALSGSAGSLSLNKSDAQKLEITLDKDAVTTSPAKITFDGLEIAVDDSKANPGDEVEVKVSGADMDKETLIVAKFVDYDVTVEEGTSKTLVAGHSDQEIGEFFINEGAAGSLVGNRTIKLELPEGVEWTSEDTGATEITNSSSITIDNKGYVGDSEDILKWEVAAKGSNDSKEGAKIKFKDMKVNVSPKFSGDLKVEVSGSAGAEGTIKVAEVVPAATISVEKVNNVILGKANQKLSDITITEGDVEGLLEGDIILNLDAGYRFSDTPKVEVAEGDIDIDTDVTVNDGTLTINVKDQSDKTASKIVISDVSVDAYRTAPEGPITIEFAKGDSALNDTDFDKDSAGKAVVANCVTSAMGDTMGNGQFVIGSNIYQVNGVKKVMDCAPYIKGDRTYVPVRYLAYVVGVSEDDVVWDNDARKVTLTKGETVVEMTIGSTTMYVNGEALTMDVAPEITSDRTMLPAR
ncbi:MAG: copper amine oxidase N-terminal domain-containing protein, partial [Syntrophomonadaceae bacterium]|nr:copper amine oxidase N-terminal domain-containing protein [Syntrophomonadaceae bacterium]